MGLQNDDVAVVRKGWEIVARNQHKISSLVMDMLSFSKERDPDPVPSDLVALVSDIVETVHQRAAEIGATITWAPPTNLPTLLFDPDALSRAILNVVTNALDAVEENGGGTVTIGVECDAAGRIARVRVADDGAGMSPETLEGIFNLFVSTKGARGTGLGLTVSRKILREHGGDIRATSVAGGGSTFVLEFPMRTEADLAENGPPHDRPTRDEAVGDVSHGGTAVRPVSP
jgi:signal transduction histidine kinase